MRTSPAIFVVPFILVVAGCGPVAIGTAIASGGGGGGSTPINPDARALDAQQTMDGAIRLEWRMVQPNQRASVFWLEWSADEVGSGRVPSSALTFESGAPLVGAEQTFTAATGGADGVKFVALWEHARQLGRTEARNAKLSLVFRDAERADELRRDFFVGPTIGRKLGEISPLTLSRSGGNEGFIDGTFEIADEGDDPTTFEVEYSLTPIHPWQAVSNFTQPPRTPIAGRSQGTYRATFQLPTVANGQPVFPFAVYPECGFRVRHTENWSRHLTPRASGPSPWSVQRFATTIGTAPNISKVTVLDPNANASLRNEPRFVLPVTIEVTSLSQVKQRLTFDGEYWIDNGATRPRTGMRFARTNELGTKLSIDLGPGETIKHYLIWNLVANEGLGIVDTPPPAARVFIRATVEATPPDGGTPLRTAHVMSQGTTGIQTPPFATYRELLQDPVEQLTSGAIGRSNRTRDIFFTRLAAQEYLINVNQTFSPIRIRGLAEFDIRTIGGVNNGIAQGGGMYPVNFLEGQPECLIRIAQNESQFYYLTWPREANMQNQGLPTSTTIPFTGGRVGGLRVVGGRKEFEVMVNGRPLPAYFFMARDDYGGTNPWDVTLHLLSIVHDGQATQPWLTNSQPFIRRMPPDPFRAGNGLPSLGPNFVVGDLDGNSATREVLIGNPGIERAQGTRTGLFDIYALDVGPSGQISARELARPPLPPGIVGVDRNISTGSSWSGRMPPIPIGPRSSSPVRSIAWATNGGRSRSICWSTALMASSTAPGGAS